MGVFIQQLCMKLCPVFVWSLKRIESTREGMGTYLHTYFARNSISPNESNPCRPSPNSHKLKDGCCKYAKWSSKQDWVRPKRSFGARASWSEAFPFRSHLGNFTHSHVCQQGHLCSRPDVDGRFLFWKQGNVVKGVKTSAGKGFENLRIVLVIFGVERIRRQPCCLGSERESERDYGFMLTFTRLLEFLSWLRWLSVWDFNAKSCALGSTRELNHLRGWTLNFSTWRRC